MSIKLILIFFRHHTFWQIFAEIPHNTRFCDFGCLLVVFWHSPVRTQKVFRGEGSVTPRLTLSSCLWSDPVGARRRRVKALRRRAPPRASLNRADGLASPAQRHRIPRGPRLPAAGLHQGNFTFFCDVIFMTDSLYFDSVRPHFFGLFFPLLFSQEQVAACCLVARFVLLLFEHDKTWAIVEELCVKVMDQVKGAEDVQTHCHTHDGTSDFMSTTAAALTTPLHLTSVEFARGEMQVWKGRILPLPRTSNPLREWRHGAQMFGCLFLLARLGLAIPATSASPERLFSASGNTIMARPRSGALCHVIILRNACIYMMPGLKSVSGPQTTRSSTCITSSFWPLFLSLTFSLRRGVLLVFDME